MENSDGSTRAAILMDVESELPCTKKQTKRTTDRVRSARVDLAESHDVLILLLPSQSPSEAINGFGDACLLLQTQIER